ncbi:hypothetical protein NDU88_004550 [Pleurodeles waltl]|uniref:Uncharacterized protein n=1 Tax=Pleurodeles waltl TaxID=8319 RepID=A0AAV7V3V9_PLEWA|nr:hypothetical protein NDU88_004550 [Pleurodeles waltl]
MYESHRGTHESPVLVGTTERACVIRVFQVWDRLCGPFASLVGKVGRERGGGLGITSKNITGQSPRDKRREHKNIFF